MAHIIQTADLTPEALSRLSQDDQQQVYNCLDTCVTLEVEQKLLPLLDNVSSSTYSFALALQAPILEMTMRGTLIDLDKRQETLGLYKRQIAQVETQLNRIIKDGLNVELNWRSPHQLRTLFYGVLGITPIRKRGADGKLNPTVDREALEKLSAHYFAEPLCLRLLNLRDLDKKRQFLETGLDPDGRIRTNYNIAGTDTGRLASSLSDYGTGGNLQNVDRELREVFIADPGMKFANIDLEQADARNVGAICWNLFRASHGDAFAGAFLNACEGGDLHTTVCRMAWPHLVWTGDRKLDRPLADGIAYRALSYRDLAKKLGHGSNYMGQPGTMAKHSKVPVKQIAEFQDNYFRSFGAIPLWHKRVEHAVRHDHQLTTLFGRRRYFFGHPNDQDTLRAAVAYEPQSMTADEIDTGLLALWRANICQVLGQVHDSLLIQYPEEREDEILPRVLSLMKAPLVLAGGREFYVPLDAKVGWNWGDTVYNRDGSVKSNPEGLQKYKGGDPRKREVKRGFSLKDL